MCSPLSFSINGYDIIVYEDMYYVVRYINTLACVYEFSALRSALWFVEYVGK